MPTRMPAREDVPVKSSTSTVDNPMFLNGAVGCGKSRTLCATNSPLVPPVPPDANASHSYASVRYIDIPDADKYEQHLATLDLNHFDPLEDSPMFELDDAQMLAPHQQRSLLQQLWPYAQDPVDWTVWPWPSSSYTSAPRSLLPVPPAVRSPPPCAVLPSWPQDHDRDDNDVYVNDQGCPETSSVHSCAEASSPHASQRGHDDDVHMYPLSTCQPANSTQTSIRAPQYLSNDVAGACIAPSSLMSLPTDQVSPCSFGSSPSPSSPTTPLDVTHHLFPRHQHQQQPPITIHHPRPRRRIPIISLSQLASACEDENAVAKQKVHCPTTTMGMDLDSASLLSPLAHEFWPQSAVVPADHHISQSHFRPGTNRYAGVAPALLHGDLDKVVVCSCGCSESFRILIP